MEWLIAPVLLVAFILWIFSRHSNARTGASHDYPIFNDFTWLSDTVRSLSTWICGGKGCGKSSLIGMELCFRTFMAGVGQLIIESSGGGALTDYFLHKVQRYAQTLPEDEQEKVYSRIIYIDMAAIEGYVTSWPLLDRTGCQSLFGVVQRMIDTMMQLDPTLATGAPVEGASALREIANNIGMILAALDLQITEANSLLNEPSRWKQSGLLDEAIRRFPEVAPAVRWYRKYYSRWKEENAIRKTGLFRAKTEMFSLDPLQRAIYAGEDAFDFTVLDRGITVIVDFRHVLDSERCRWGMTWIFQLFMSFVKSRPLRGEPIHLCLDELAQFVSADINGQNLFSTELDKLINVLARNKRVYATLMNQSLLQLNEQMRATLMTCGNKMIGYQANLEAAIEFGKHLFPYRGQHIKKVEPIFVGSPNGPTKVGERQTEFTPAEYERMVANAFMQLPSFHFFVQSAEKEGSASTQLGMMDVPMDNADWPDRQAVAALRKKLVKQSGRPMQDILAEIEKRQQNMFDLGLLPIQMIQPDADATLNSNEYNDHLPINEFGDESETDLSN